MRLEVTPKAQQWLKEEAGVQPETGICPFEEIYGKIPVHDGFSAAMPVEASDEPMIKKNLDGIIYLIGGTDDWFPKGYNLIIDYDEKDDKPRYQFEASQEDLAK